MIRAGGSTALGLMADDTEDEQAFEAPDGAAHIIVVRQHPGDAGGAGGEGVPRGDAGGDTDGAPRPNLPSATPSS
jgi:hypothetical protein